ncbi:MAG: glycosyltransferase family 2 protein [Desulfobacterales bacterium]|jgi:hypothetical protein
MKLNRLRRNVYQLICDKISAIVRFSDEVRYYGTKEGGDDMLGPMIAKATPSFATVDLSDGFSELQPSSAAMCMHVFNGIFNSNLDIQNLLMTLKKRLCRRDRVVVVLYNPYLRWLYRLLDRLGIRQGPAAHTFITETDLQNFAKISGFQVVTTRYACGFCFNLFGIGRVLDRIIRLIPGFRNISLVYIAVLRPIIAESEKPGLSVIVPARNERGNISNAIQRLSDRLDCPLEIIFVEGHSTDNTWDEIQRVVSEYKGPFSLRTLRQTGKGKMDASRLGLLESKYEILTILDADLTMPPEMLGRFYAAYCEGHADFVNGSRLVYPMEGDAMRFLNRLGNIFFAKAVSYVLGVRLGDTLCGTKLFCKADYKRFCEWRSEFGDFDPFGDFELLFPAAILGLGIVDIPIAYRDRTYGSTNISRFRHGLMLLKMVAIGFFRIKSR